MSETLSKVILFLFLFLGLCFVLFLCIWGFKIFRLKESYPFPTSLVKEYCNIYQRVTIKHQWISLDKLSRNLVLMVLLIEDWSFFYHRGIISYKVVKAICMNLRARKIKCGYSTITQQLAKNLFLYRNRTIVRKLMELCLTILMELFVPKRRLLEIYLNIIEWEDGNFGIEAASRHFFEKSSADLTIQESLILTTMMPAPQVIHPIKNEKVFLWRWKLYLSILSQYGIIGRSDYERMAKLNFAAIVK